MDIKLYYAPITCAMVSYVALIEAGLDFEIIPLNFRKAEHLGQEYLAINPKHKVPCSQSTAKRFQKIWPL